MLKRSYAHLQMARIMRIGEDLYELVLRLRMLSFLCPLLFPALLMTVEERVHQQEVLIASCAVPAEVFCICAFRRDLLGMPCCSRKVGYNLFL